MHPRFPLMMTALALIAGILPAADAAVLPAHTKKQAEVNVLRVIPRKWKTRPLRGLVNPRTHLLLDNTEAVCRGRGMQRAGRRYSRFVCVIRPHIHTRRQGLYVSYTTLPKGGFKIRWLAYRRR
jgi:hypothetical protein